MRFKYIILFIVLIFILSLGLGAVNAFDENNTSHLEGNDGYCVIYSETNDAAEIDDDKLELQKESDISENQCDNDLQTFSNESFENLGLKQESKTFTDLNNLINNDKSGEIKLDYDYVYTNGIDFNLTDGIERHKHLTIDGQGHTIDAKNQARFFNMYGGNLILKNIKLINGFSSKRGGAILAYSYNVTVINSSFDNCSSDRGGVIENRNGDVFVFNSNFTNNVLNDYNGDESTKGGAIYDPFGNILIENSNFINNSAVRGGSIYTEESNVIIINSSFSYNMALYYGGALFVGGNMSISGSTFENCSSEYGGVIYSFSHLSISDSIFKNNFAEYDAGALVTMGNLSIFNSSFTNSTSLDSALIKAYNQNTTIVMSDFNNNQGSKDVIFCDGNLLFSNSTFTNNNGGIATIQVDGDGKLENSIFNNNHASYTGVARIFGKATISNSQFSSNVGEQSVGAVYCEDMIVKNSTFTNNLGYYYNTFFDETSIADSKIIENNKDVTYKYVKGYTNSLKKKQAIKKSAPTLKAPKKTFKAKVKIKKYSVTLKVGKNPLKNVKVQLSVKGKKFKKTFTAKTNKKGKATFRIKKLTKKGSYTTILKYKGSKTVKSITINQKIKITKKKFVIKQKGKPVLGKNAKILYDGYLDASGAFKSLNNFRTQKGVWMWNEDDKTKTYFNTNANNTLKPLKWSEDLAKTAKIRAKEIAILFSHDRLDGTSCFSAYPDYFFCRGENIAWGATSAEEVTEMWKETNEDFNGQGHRQNMLSGGYDSVGIAAYQKDGGIFWVQCFGGGSLW